MTQATASYRCPSNIALIKYWGKKEGGIQLPANPSLSLTLSDLFAETTVTLAHGNVSGKPAFSFLLDGKPKPGFENKMRVFLQRLWDDILVVREYHLHIESKNNFPHGTGIASSAAGFGALALCILDLEQQITGVLKPDFMHEASRMARLGSGSACRSLYGEPAVWGKHDDVLGSNDEYAIPLNIEVSEPLNQLMDAVLIIDAGEKKVSSSEGHALVKGSRYAEARYKEAEINLGKLTQTLQKGNVRSFISIVESEALQLHAMMMLGNPYYLLMRPNTLAVIEKIWAYREKHGTPVMFTLDAGANVHVLFPAQYTQEIVHFIESELLGFCENGQYLCSTTGGAPLKLA